MSNNYTVFTVVIQRVACLFINEATKSSQTGAIVNRAATEN